MLLEFASSGIQMCKELALFDGGISSKCYGGEPSKLLASCRVRKNRSGNIRKVLLSAHKTHFILQWLLIVFMYGNDHTQTVLCKLMASGSPLEPSERVCALQGTLPRIRSKALVSLLCKTFSIVALVMFVLLWLKLPQARQAAAGPAHVFRGRSHRLRD
jgi:hypothetical protein